MPWISRSLMILVLILLAGSIYAYTNVQPMPGWQYSVVHAELDSVSALWFEEGTLFASLETRHNDGKIIAISEGITRTLVDGLEKPDGLVMSLGNLVYTQESGKFPVFKLVSGKSQSLFMANGAEGIDATRNGDIFIIEDRPAGNLTKYDHSTGEATHLLSGLEEAEGICAFENGIIYFSEKSQGVVYKLEKGLVSHFIDGLNNPAYLHCDERDQGIWITEDRRNLGRLLYADQAGALTTIAALLRAPQSIAFNATGELFLAEQGRNRILMFERTPDDSAIK